MLRRASALRSCLHTASKKLSYTQRMDKTGRSLSPHLTIYRLPLISFSSVTARITGIMCSAGVIATAGLTLFGGSDFPAQVVHELGPASKRVTGYDVTPAAKFVVSYPIVYHWLENFRHMVRDVTAKGFTNNMMLQSARVLYVGIAAVSLGLACCSLQPLPPLLCRRPSFSQPPSRPLSVRTLSISQSAKDAFRKLSPVV